MDSKKSILFVSVFLALFSMWSADAEDLLEPEPYTDTTLGFEIHHPKGWQVDKSGSDVQVQFNDPTPDEVALITLEVGPDQGASLKDYARTVFANFKDEGGPNAHVEIINETERAASGQPAYEIEYRFNINEIPLHGLYLILLAKGKGYSLNAVSQEALWEKNKDRFNASFLMFKLLP